MARFIPGGRAAVMFAAGVVELPWRSRFVPFEVAGAALWTAAAALGYFFGTTIQDSVWLPILISLAIGALISVAAELVRRARTEPADEAAPRG